ncbi:MAG: hypothetical protein QMD96_07210 [Anaerosomatales bacterium]|nr:hypothetical protein [Anaerosomatales bacterium]
MSGELIAAVVVVILSSTTFIAVGTLTGWDFTSRTYAYAMRALGVATLVALGAVAAWSRRGEPVAAAAILVAAGLASFGYVRAHVSLTRRLTDQADGDRASRP